MKDKFQILLVEDHPEYREILGLALASSERANLAYQFGTADQALHVLQHNEIRMIPDLILLDLNLPGLSGIDAIPWFLKYVPKAPIIVLTQSEREADVMAAVTAGASGYLLKSSSKQQLLDGIDLVMDGGAPIDPKIAKYILETLRRVPQKLNTDGVLSEREIEVLSLMGDGLLKKEIADRLKISGHTVDNHIRHIYGKLNVQNAPAAIAKAFRTGIFPS